MDPRFTGAAIVPAERTPATKVGEVFRFQAISKRQCDRIAVGVGGDVEDQPLEHDGIRTESGGGLRAGGPFVPSAEARHRNDFGPGQDPGDQERILAAQRLERTARRTGRDRTGPGRVLKVCSSRVRRNRPTTRVAHKRGAALSQRAIDRERHELPENIPRWAATARAASPAPRPSARPPRALPRRSRDPSLVR